MLILSEHDAARLGIEGAKPRMKRGRNTRPELPRAEAGTGDRIAQLDRIARFGFSPRWDAGVGFCFWRLDGRRTTAHEDYAQACIAAEKELRP